MSNIIYGSMPTDAGLTPRMVEQVRDEIPDAATVIDAADRAEAAATTSAAIAADVHEISGLTGEDGAVAFLVDDPTSATSAALDSHSVVHRPPQGTTGGHELGINAFLSANVGRICRIVGDFTINGPIIVPSDTTLDATEATITLAAKTRMLQNTALLGAGPRDKNIHIRGGHWDRGDNAGATNLDNHSVVLHRVDGASITDATFMSLNGKYATYMVDVTDGLFQNLHFDHCYSDGVHVTGPASRITVRNITGSTGDDLVSFTARDFPFYEFTPGGGDIDTVVVENITMHEAYGGNIVKLLAGEGVTLSHARVAGVRGPALFNGVTLYSDAAQTSTIGGVLSDIIVRDVQVSTPDGYSAIHVNTAVDDRLLVDGVTQLNPRGHAALFNGPLCVVKSAILRSLQTVGTSDRWLMRVGAEAVIGMLDIDSPQIDLQATPTATGRMLFVSGAVGNVAVTNPRVTGGTALVFVEAGGEASSVSIVGGKAAGMSQLVDHAGAGALELYVSGVDVSDTPFMVVARGAAGCSAVVRGGQLTGGSPIAIYGIAGQAVRAVGVDLKADITRAGYTPAAGDVVMNTNGAAPSGAGLHLRVGDTWTNLSSL